MREHKLEEGKKKKDVKSSKNLLIQKCFQDSVHFPYVFLTMTSLLKKKMCRAQFSILRTWAFAKENAPLSS